LAFLYGHTPAKEFGPRALKAVRERMTEGYEHPEFGTQRPLSRGVINQRIGRIRRMFKWAVAEELLSETVYRALMAVPGLQRSRSQARETEPVSRSPMSWLRPPCRICGPRWPGCGPVKLS
jgi:hypothetical protein